MKATPILFLLIVCLAASQTMAAPVASLQTLIEQTPEGGVVRLAAGRDTGPVVVEKAGNLDGRGQVTISFDRLPDCFPDRQS